MNYNEDDNIDLGGFDFLGNTIKITDVGIVGKDYIDDYLSYDEPPFPTASDLVDLFEGKPDLYEEVILLMRSKKIEKIRKNKKP